ncbi:MAG: methyltransferase domain-containing protein [Oscillospiraceae bacterium]|nr:methyltransferase domain-containing protein [Oscillospiraceae bacterium]
MSLFLCPICKQPLEQEPNRYVCPTGHSYDIASAGYVHLLPANQKNSLLPGDDKRMAAARNRFLNGGWYQPLRDAIAQIVAVRLPEGGVLFDSGCGEGYYTAGAAQLLRDCGKKAQIYGIDISKFSLRWAAKRDRSIAFAVASAYHLPLPDTSVDVLVNCFSPMAAEEFSRVVKPGGWLLYVVPAPRHLWEMKCVLYDRPYENREQRIDYPGFGNETVTRIDYSTHLPDQQTIQDLFGMTPYVWKTPKEGAARLAQLDALDTQISFDLHLFEREG